MITAVEWLVEELPILKTQLLEKVVAKAKEMEKEQIIKAHAEGFYSEPFKSRKGQAVKYYNETFKSE